MRIIFGGRCRGWFGWARGSWIGLDDGMIDWIDWRWMVVWLH